MRQGGGKQKGASFEREVCKRLSLWLSHGTAEDLLWRSAMSGGRSTVGRKKGKLHSAQAGDISAVDARGNPFIDKFYVECKAYKDLDFGNLIKGTGHLIDFWKLAKEDAARYRKRPLLIAKQNNHPIIVCVNGRVAGRYDRSLFKVSVYEANLYIALWEDFLTLNPKEFIKW